MRPLNGNLGAGLPRADPRTTPGSSRRPPCGDGPRPPRWGGWTATITYYPRRRRRPSRRLRNRLLHALHGNGRKGRRRAAAGAAGDGAPATPAPARQQAAPPPSAPHAAASFYAATARLLARQKLPREAYRDALRAAATAAVSRCLLPPPPA
eukprot:gene4447-20640_t